jgi:shikimate kinase
LIKGAVTGTLGGKTATSKPRPKVRALVLIGFMGAGKSSVGRALGEQLDWTFEDLDDRIELREQRKVAEIFRETGESGFRRAEHAALKKMLSELQDGSEKVVALGGGAFAQKANARLIEAASLPTVFLDAEVEELWRRCREQTGMERPLLGSEESFRNLYEVRRPHYLKAQFRQETGGKTVKQIAQAVVQVLGLDLSRGTRGEKQ